MKDITTNLFRVKNYTDKPACGALLVAEPFLKESYFNHGVVSLIDYIPSEGATGVVMNNNTDYKLGELLDGVDPELDIPVFCGGPVGQDRLFFIHTLGPDIIPQARQYAPGLYVGGDFDTIINYVNAGYPTEGVVRFFIGYCNWVEGQLERELREETWAMAPAPSSASDLLQDVADPYWHRTVRSMGSRYRSWSLMPRNTSAN